MPPPLRTPRELWAGLSGQARFDRQGRLDFLEENYVDEYTRPFEARPWLVENLFKPADGFKAWPRTPDGPTPKLCPLAQARATRIFPTRRHCWHAPHDGCDGLRGYKVLYVVLEVTRQDGKTFGVASYSMSDLVQWRNTTFTFMAASEGQSGRIFDDKWGKAIRLRPVLDADKGGPLGLEGMGIANPARNNSFRYVPTSNTAIPGGTQRRVAYDEVRDVDPETIIRGLPLTSAANGIECPHGHSVLPFPTDQIPEDGALPVCSTCGVEMHEWFGVTFLTSSAGEDTDFFSDLVDTLRETPHWAWHVFSTQARLNRAKSAEAVKAVEEVLGRMSSVAPLVQREFGNVRASKGDQFMTKAEIAAITNPELRNADFSERPCVGFLDCSETTDLTALVICEDVAVEKKPTFSKIRTARIDVFDPAKLPGHRVRYRPNDPPDGTAVQEHLAEAMRRFPGLVKLWIDVTLLKEAEDLFTWTQRQPWRGKVIAWRGQDPVDDLMWDALEARMIAGRAEIEIQGHPRLTEELRKAKTMTTERGTRKVMDSATGNKRSKKRRHRDVSMALAGCCWIADVLRAKGSTLSSGQLLERANQSTQLAGRFKPLVSNVTNSKW